jgi:hypothetical protein
MRTILRSQWSIERRQAGLGSKSHCELRLGKPGQRNIKGFMGFLYGYILDSTSSPAAHAADVASMRSTGDRV